MLKWWQVKEVKWPNLAKMVKQYFAAPASSAGVERVFSAAGKMHGDLSKSAKDETLKHAVSTEWRRTRSLSGLHACRRRLEDHDHSCVAMYTQHVPIEFEEDTHYLQLDGEDVEPIKGKAHQEAAQPGAIQERNCRREERDAERHRCGPRRRFAQHWGDGAPAEEASEAGPAT